MNDGKRVVTSAVLVVLVPAWRCGYQMPAET